MATKKDAVAETPAALFTKEQLLGAKALGLPRDAVSAVLKDGEMYTRDRAARLVSDFLKRKV